MLDQFISELKNNARLRIGIALILAVLWLYFILLMRDALDNGAREYRGSSVTLGKLQSVVQEGDWAERLAAAKTLQAEMESALWRGDSSGLANASFQDWLNQQMQLAGVARPTVSVGAGSETEPSSGIEDLWHVRAKMTFDFNSDSLNKLLGQIGAHPQHVVIESLHVTKEPIPRVEIMASAYFQQSEPAQ